jgi:hypothetical protein
MIDQLGQDIDRTDNQRLQDIAGLLAKVYLRLQEPLMRLSAGQNVADSTADCLDCGTKSSLTVHTS